jgi:hypothetical protein
MRDGGEVVSLTRQPAALYYLPPGRILVLNYVRAVVRLERVRQIMDPMILSPRVEAGKNTSTVIPASRKMRRKGNRISLR